MGNHFRRTFSHREDGAFEIELGPGNWSVQATSKDFPACTPATITIAKEKSSEVVLRLVEPIRGSGVVLSEETGDPVPGAEIQPFSMDGERSVFPWGPPFTSGQDGRFEGRAFVVGSNSVNVQANGYASAKSIAWTDGTRELDFGQIRLARPQRLSVHLNSAGVLGTSLERVTAYSVDGRLPETAFGADGWVHFEDVSPGSHRLIIQRTPTSWSRLDLELKSGSNWSFEHRVSDSQRLEVVVYDANGTIVEEGIWLLASSLEGNGLFTLRAEEASVNARWTFEGITASLVNVIAFDFAGQELGGSYFSFDKSPFLVGELHLGGAPLHVLVLDAEGQPRAGARVRARSKDGLAVFGLQETGPDGRVALLGVPTESVLIDVHDDVAGSRIGSECDASVREHTILMGPSGSVTFLVEDEGVALENVVASVVSAGKITLLDPRSTDLFGSVSFVPMGEGRFWLDLARSDCWPVTLEQNLGPGEARQVSVSMRRLSDLELTVVDADGLLVSDVEVELVSTEFGTLVSEWVAQGKAQAPKGFVTDLAGKLAVHGVPRGRYSWVVNVADGRFAGSFELEAGSANRPRLQLSP
jgi:hypothetical protein